MSAINGDKARFHRKRKAGIARRARNRERLQSGNQGNTGIQASRKKEA
ncbi:MAG TPA: hypothetical protein VFM77_13780 [Terriglobales bacterium]|nr:hypothetical protein [Terriglobales bacterium]